MESSHTITLLEATGLVSRSMQEIMKTLDDFQSMKCFAREMTGLAIDSDRSTDDKIVTIPMRQPHHITTNTIAAAQYSIAYNNITNDAGVQTLINYISQKLSSYQNPSLVSKTKSELFETFGQIEIGGDRPLNYKPLLKNESLVKSGLAQDYHVRECLRFYFEGVEPGPKEDNLGI